MKKYLIIILIICMFFITSCGKKDKNNSSIDIGDINKMTEIPDGCAPHERLLIEADNYVVAAERSDILGQNIIKDYYYGMALSSVCSLRYAIENILYYRGYKDNLVEIQNGAIYTKFDKIVETSFSSFWPFYFEGLIYELTGDKENSDIYYEIARDNDIYYNADFYYLKNLSFDELLQIRDYCLVKERSIDDFYTPFTKIISATPCGLEQYPAYHLYAMELAVDEENYEIYKQCAINFLYVTPTLKDGYVYACIACMANNDIESANYYINEGLWMFDDDPDINFYAGTLYKLKNMNDLANECFRKALNSTDATIKAKAQEYLK